MNQYESLRQHMKTGDTVACKNEALFSKVIRVFTGESINHVGCVYVDELGGIWISEMRGNTGHNWKPALEWFKMMERKGVKTWWCTAPYIVNREKAGNYLLDVRYENPDYGWWQLLVVWWSQLLDKDIDAHGNPVCSVHCQRMHEAGGYTDYPQLADPGDIFEHAPSATRVT